MQTKTIGFMLIIVGIMMIAYTGFNFITTEKVIDFGTVEINSKKNNVVQWSPVVGVVALVGGVVMVVASGRSRA
jgi:uncharacterized membrane protein YidH (DUF202 family)